MYLDNYGARIFMLKNYISPFTVCNKLTIIDLGEEDYAKLVAKPLVQRLHYIIHFVVSGEGTFKTLNAKIQTENDLKENCAFAIHKGDTPNYQSKAENPLYYFWIGFDGDDSENIMRYIGFSHEHPVLTMSDSQAIINAFRSLFSAWKAKDSYDFLARFFLLIKTLRENNKYTNDNLALPVKNEIALQAKQYIQENIYKNITVGSVADALNITRNHFSKIFKENFQITPHEYINRLKLKNAESLLKTTNYRISEIADLLNYPDIYTFSKAFKRVYKKTPLEFRKLL